MAEIIGRRTRHAKHFDNGDGTFNARITSGPQHFLDVNDQWQDMADLIAEVPGGWAATSKDVRYGIENGYLTISRNGKSITMRPTAIGMVDRTAPNTRWRKLGDADYTNVTRDGNTITAHDIFPNTDLTVRITDETMSKQFVIRQRPNYPDPITLGWNPATTFLVIVWDVSKPAGATVRDTQTLEVVANGYAGNNDLVVEDGTGTPVVYFKKGEGWSAKQHKYPVWYVSLGAQVPFGEAFSYEKAAIATYPLTLDPTSTIYPPSGASDGYLRSSPGGDGTFDPDPGYSVVVVGSGSYEDAYDKTNYWMPQRAYFRFSLSGISGTVTLAEFKCYLLSEGFAVAIDHSVYLHAADWLSLSSDDWNASATLQSTITLSATEAVGYKTWGLDESAIQSRLGGVAALDLRGHEGAGWTTGNWASSEASSNDPYLSITYTTNDAGGDSLASIYEGLVRVAVLNRATPQTLGSVTEAAIRAAASRARATSDTISSIADAVDALKVTLRAAADAVADVAESVARSAASMVRSAADSASSIADSLSRAAASRLRAAADSVPAITDAASYVASVVRSAVDLVASTTESVVRSAAVLARASADAVTSLLESIEAVVQAVGNFFRTADDSLPSVSEATSRLMVMGRSAGATVLSVAEAAARAVMQPRATADTIGSFSETVARASLVAARAASDVIGSVVESIFASVQVGIREFVRAAADAVSSVTDAVTRSGVFSRVSSDALASVSDAVDVLAQFYRQAADSVSSVAEIVARSAMSSARAVAEVIADIGETASRQIVSLRDAADAISTILDAVAGTWIGGYAGRARATIVRSARASATIVRTVPSAGIARVARAISSIVRQ